MCWRSSAILTIFGWVRVKTQVFDQPGQPWAVAIAPTASKCSCKASFVSCAHIYCAHSLLLFYSLPWWTDSRLPAMRSANWAENMWPTERFVGNQREVYRAGTQYFSVVSVGHCDMEYGFLFVRSWVLVILLWNASNFGLSRFQTESTMLCYRELWPTNSLFCCDQLNRTRSDLKLEARAFHSKLIYSVHVENDETKKMEEPNFYWELIEGYRVR